MSKNRVRRPQRRKQNSRLGYNLSSIALDSGTYNGGFGSRVLVKPVSDD